MSAKSTKRGGGVCHERRSGHMNIAEVLNENRPITIDSRNPLITFILTSICSSHRSSLRFFIKDQYHSPALLIKISTGPKSDIVCWTRRFT